MFTRVRACNLSTARAFNSMTFYCSPFREHFLGNMEMQTEIQPMLRMPRGPNRSLSPPLPQPHIEILYTYILVIFDIDALPFHRVVIHDLRF